MTVLVGLLRLNMRLAIITGGSRGLGFALCAQFSNLGYRVLEFSRTAPHKFSICVDLSLPEDSRRCIADAIASFDTASLSELVVINNAGTLEPIGPSELLISNEPQPGPLRRPQGVPRGLETSGFHGEDRRCEPSGDLDGSPVM